MSSSSKSILEGLFGMTKNVEKGSDGIGSANG
jgi:hypothetical protein